jgi:sugar O-acyltransferase (sialic acid O-acetyltransferase NeuD family)
MVCLDMIRNQQEFVRLMKRVLILGVAGGCLDILDTINDINRAAGTTVYDCIGLLDDNRTTWGQSFMGVECLGPLESATEYPDCWFINGIGSQRDFWRKRKIIATTGVPLDRFETIIHPTASVSKAAKLGFGTVVFPNATITHAVSIGNHAIVEPATLLGHDVFVGDYCCITPGVCLTGGVHVEQSCYLGCNSTVRNNVRIGEYCLVGMGAVVLRDVPRNSVVVGNPARVIRKTSENL